jgi:23S rRNA pseudouridine2457 synthase
LKDFFKVPVDVYPVGRLDYDSEGLLILTNDTSLNARLLNPAFSHEREYWVQVEGDISDEAINSLSRGVRITVDGKPYTTKKSVASKMKFVPDVPERVPPIRVRKHIPDSWLSLTLTEGKNRQVRKMTATTGFPTLRLIRYRIERLTLQQLQPGEMKELNRTTIYDLLFA